MKLTLFIKDERDAAKWPQIDLADVSTTMFGHHTCFGDRCDDRTEIAIHHFTPAHARALIKMLTPIAAQATGGTA